MNRVTITGRLTKDPVSAERGGTQVCDLRIAENGRNGEPMYVDVAVFGRQGEACRSTCARAAWSPSAASSATRSGRARTGLCDRSTRSRPSWSSSSTRREASSARASRQPPSGFHTEHREPGLRGPGSLCVLAEPTTSRPLPRPACPASRRLWGRAAWHRSAIPASPCGAPCGPRPCGPRVPGSPPGALRRGLQSRREEVGHAGPVPSEPEALATRIYRERRAYLLRIARRNSLNRADAEEALQEAFIAFLRAYDPERGAHPLAWLTLVLKRECWQKSRSEHLDRRAGQEAELTEGEIGCALELIPDPGRSPHEVAELARRSRTSVSVSLSSSPRSAGRSRCLPSASPTARSARSPVGPTPRSTVASPRAARRFGPRGWGSESAGRGLNQAGNSLRRVSFWWFLPSCSHGLEPSHRRSGRPDARRSKDLGLRAVAQGPDPDRDPGAISPLPGRSDLPLDRFPRGTGQRGSPVSRAPPAPVVCIPAPTPAGGRPGTGSGTSRRKVSFEDSVDINGVKTALVNTGFRVPRPHIAKYFRYPGPQEAGDDRSSDHHYCLYRYADVLLMAAEAIGESDGATDEAIGYVNQIRARARFNGTTTSSYPADVTAGISKEDFIKVVREERRLEFAFEFNRWYDIKRWGILDEAFTQPESLEPHDVDTNRDYLFPIPQTEVDATNFSQNPGY